jgi:hypothetical protein
MAVFVLPSTVVPVKHPCAGCSRTIYHGTLCPRCDEETHALGFATFMDVVRYLFGMRKARQDDENPLP